MGSARRTGHLLGRMTYNAYFFLDYEGTDTRQNRTLSFILSQNADLVCLQESPGLIAPNPGLKITGEQIDSIHTLYPYRIPTTHGMNFLSKYPATLLFDTVYSESSAIAIYQVKIEGHTVTVVNQHMESIGLTQTDKELYHEITGRNKETLVVQTHERSRDSKSPSRPDSRENTKHSR